MMEFSDDIGNINFGDEMLNKYIVGKSPPKARGDSPKSPRRAQEDTRVCSKLDPRPNCAHAPYDEVSLQNNSSISLEKKMSIDDSAPLMETVDHFTVNYKDFKELPKSRLFIVFESGQSSSEHTQKRSTEPCSTMYSIELQTDTIYTDNSVHDYLKLFVRSVLKKLLEKSHFKLIDEKKLSEFIDVNQSKCVEIVEKIFEDVLCDFYVNLEENISKEEILAEYDYITNLNKTESDKSFLCTSNTKHGKHCTTSEGDAKVDITKEIVRELLRTCTDLSTSSENSNPSRIFLRTNADIPSSNKVDAHNTVQDESYLTSNIGHTLKAGVLLVVEKGKDIELKSLGKINLNRSKAAYERKVLSENDVRRGEEIKKNKRKKQFLKLKKMQRIAQAYESARDVEKHLKEVNLESTSLMPIKSSVARKCISLDESEHLGRGANFISKLCMFFCRKMCTS